MITWFDISWTWQQRSTLGKIVMVALSPLWIPILLLIVILGPTKNIIRDIIR